jgi:hypothetical protein
VQDIVAKRSTKARARKRLDKEIEPIVWRSAAGLVRQLQTELGLALALMEITTAARNGQIRTQVRAVRRDTELRTDLTAELWQVLKLVAVMNIPQDERGFPQHQLSSWTGQVRLELVDDAPFPAESDWILWGARLFVCEADCRKLWPTEKPAPEETASTDDRHGGGRKDKFEWDAILVEGVLRWNARGRQKVADVNLSELAEELRSWCEKHLGWAEVPAAVTIRKRLGDMLRSWELAQPRDEPKK